MIFQGSVIKEQGMTFAIVVVRQDTINNEDEANNTIELFTQFFELPVVLMAQNDGTPLYFGKEEFVTILKPIPLEKIPWQKYSIN